MTPTPEPEHRAVYRDPKDRLEVRHIVHAAHLVLSGHPLLYVRKVQDGPTIFTFDPDARPALERMERMLDELNAERERNRQVARS